MVFPEAAVEEVEAEADELERGAEHCSAACKRQAAGRPVPVGDKQGVRQQCGSRRFKRQEQRCRRPQRQWQQQQQRTPQRRVPLPLQLRRRRSSFANEGVCGSSPQATAGRRQQRQWRGGWWIGGGRTGGRGGRRRSCTRGGPQ
jgi:hypothetical protein